MDCIDVGSDMFCVMVAVMSADDGKSVVDSFCKRHAYAINYFAIRL